MYNFLVGDQIDQLYSVPLPFPRLGVEGLLSEAGLAALPL